MFVVVMIVSERCSTRAGADSHLEHRLVGNHARCGAAAMPLRRGVKDTRTLFMHGCNERDEFAVNVSNDFEFVPHSSPDFKCMQQIDFSFVL